MLLYGMIIFFHFLTSLMTLLVISSQSISAAPLPSDYADAGCISVEAANTYIKTFNIKLKSFPKLNHCDTQNPLYQILVALDVMKKLRFSNTITSSLDQGLLDTDYYHFFSKRIKAIHFASSNYGEKTSTGAYYSSGTITLYRGFSALSLPYLMSLLVHEARHADGFFHVKCKQGRKVGQTGMCDSTYARAGAYGVQIEMLARMATRGINLSQAFKSTARLAALDEAMASINEIPLNASEAIGLIEKDQSTFEMINKNGELVKTETYIFNAKRIISHPGGAIYTIAPEPQMIDPYIQMSPKSLSDLELHKNLMNFAKDPQIIDVQALGSGYITLYDFKLVWGATLKGKYFSSDRIITLTPGGQKGAFLLRGNKLFEIKKNQNTLELNENNEKWPEDLVKVVNFEGRFLGLMREGQLMWIEGLRRKAFEPSLHQRYSDLVNLKLYDEF